MYYTHIGITCWKITCFYGLVKIIPADSCLWCTCMSKSTGCRFLEYISLLCLGSRIRKTWGPLLWSVRSYIDKTYVVKILQSLQMPVVLPCQIYTTLHRNRKVSPNRAMWRCYHIDGYAYQLNVPDWTASPMALLPADNIVPFNSRSVQLGYYRSHRMRPSAHCWNSQRNAFLQGHCYNVTITIVLLCTVLNLGDHYDIFSV
jgi:hypothetical protein